MFKKKFCSSPEYTYLIARTTVTFFCFLLIVVKNKDWDKYMGEPKMHTVQLKIYKIDMIKKM